MKIKKNNSGFKAVKKNVHPKKRAPSQAKSRNAKNAFKIDKFLSDPNEDSSGSGEGNEFPSGSESSDEESTTQSLDGDIDVESDANAEESDYEPGDEVSTHKESLAKLQETDPEFYKFLQDNDKKLLDFNLSDSENDEDDESSKVHKPDGALEVASDESDFEADEDEKETDADSRVITLKMIKKWQAELHTDKTNQTIGRVIKAFNAALLNVSNPDEEEKHAGFYVVKGSSTFNAVIQLCVLELGPAIRRYLGLQSSSKTPPHKCKKFVKVKTLLKGYFTDLLKLLFGVTSSNILTVLLKHLHYMAPMLASYSSITKNILKKLVHIWSTSAESVRVVAFLCILRITTNQQTSLLDLVLKSMYLAYVNNSKFVSANSLPGINFMRRSLVEMFALDLNLSYQHIFLYIRQLAIHLRNAIVVKKKENLQAVYNWQFVNSLRLWGNLFAVTHNNNKPQIQPLLYPFVQVCLGTLKLNPTAQYFPLRFHVCQVLMDLSRDTGVFVPVLPFILEVLTAYNFNKKHTKVSMKPLHFTSLLRLSKSQLAENGFKDTCIDTIYGQVMENLANQSSSIAFPDISLFCVIQLKQFVKSCSVASYCRKMKQLLEKIGQNAEHIQNERRKVSFNLSDTRMIEAWETTIRNKGPPLLTFFESWKKMVGMKKRKQETENEEIGDFNLPMLKRAKKSTVSDPTKPVTLFPSDSESDGEEDGRFGHVEEASPEKPKRGKRGSGRNALKAAENVTIKIEDGFEQDIVQDFDASDW